VSAATFGLDLELPLLTLVQRALLAQIPADAPAASPEHAPCYVDGCPCRDCRAFALEAATLADAHHDDARAHQEAHAALVPDEDATLYPDPCPLHLIGRCGVAEGRARYARTPAAPRRRFVPTAPARRAEVWS
jgi:hypothetical protein